MNNSAASGQLKHNPFVFHHYGIDNYAMIENGMTYPAEGVKIDVPGLDIVSAYKFFLDNIGVSHSDTEIGVDINDYFQGSFVMAFDMTPDLCNGAHRHAPRSGVMELKLYLKEALSEPVTVLVLGTYDTDVGLANDTVKLDYIL